MEKEKSNQLRMWEVHDLYIQYIKEASNNKGKLRDNFFDITNEKWIKEESILRTLNLIKTCCDNIKNHLKRKNTLQYDWEYDIKEALSEIETEVSSWQKN